MEIANILATGHVRPVISRVYPLAGGRHAYGLAPMHGKVVLRVGDEGRGAGEARGR